MDLLQHTNETWLAALIPWCSDVPPSPTTCKERVGPMLPFNRLTSLFYWPDLKLAMGFALLFIPLFVMLKSQSSSPATSNGIPPANSGVRYRQWGIYTVAYDKPRRPAVSFGPNFSRLIRALREDGPSAVRLISQLFSMAPVAISIHTICTLWKSVAPALWFYLSGIILITVCVRLCRPSYSTDMATENRWKPV
jgi:hypothetical protein